MVGQYIDRCQQSYPLTMQDLQATVDQNLVLLKVPGSDFIPLVTLSVLYHESRLFLLEGFTNDNQPCI